MNKNVLIIVLLAVLLIGGAVWAWSLRTVPVVIDDTAATTTPVIPVPTATPATSTPAAPGINDLIVIASPTKDQKISSPMTVAGTARGSWYFEASFPVEVRNASGTVIGQGVAQAQGDWMTTSFVPFKGLITYTAQPSGSHGSVVFKKDNPSGDPARDMQVSIPVTF